MVRVVQRCEANLVGCSVRPDCPASSPTMHHKRFLGTGSDGTLSLVRTAGQSAPRLHIRHPCRIQTLGQSYQPLPVIARAAPAQQTGNCGYDCLHARDINPPFHLSTSSSSIHPRTSATLTSSSPSIILPAPSQHHFTPSPPTLKMKSFAAVAAFAGAAAAQNLGQCAVR